MGSQIIKVGVYVDVSNIAQNGGYGMHYDVLRQFACRNNGVAMRLNAYVAYDEEKARENWEYRVKAQNYHSMLRDFGFKVIVKKVKWYYDENGRYGKANADLDMAVDALMQSESLDYVLMVTGDGDFVQVVKALQNKGCRVEVVAFEHIANILKEEADLFISGFQIPHLLPFEYENSKTYKWGVMNGKARGVCYSFHQDKGYGFLRYLEKISSGLWITDSRMEESPYKTVFMHKSNLPEEVDPQLLPNREMIFEFTLAPGQHDKELQAVDIKLVH